MLRSDTLQQQRIQEYPRLHPERPVYSVVPILAACLMLCATFMPWLNDPLGTVYAGWQVPLDIGWQVRSPWLNYGLLCLCTALLLLYKITRRWSSNGEPMQTRPLLLAGMLCLAPVLLFFLQYLCIDLGGMNVLAQHKIQALLIQQHFSYKSSEQLYHIQPLDVTDVHIPGRLQILINQVSVGLLFPCVSAWLLMGTHLFFPLTSAPTRKKQRPFWVIGMIAGMLLLARGPLALACDLQAKTLLSLGDYTSATHWLFSAVTLNPAFEQVPYYHTQRGQAWYFLQPDKENADTHAYLASVYRQQGENLGAYQQLLAIQQFQPTIPPWVVAQTSLTLTDLTETIQRQRGQPIQRLAFDATVLPWLQALIKLDFTNVYSHYVVGRIQYDLHNYNVCIDQMAAVVQLSHNTDVQSSAYTYMGLSMSGKGDIADARSFLLKAVALDPSYHNNIAREELSGLH